MVKKRIKVLIIGGGFAGVKTVRNLYKRSDLDITLVTDQETFRYGATIWRATTGHLKEASYMPVASLVPIKPNVHLVFDRAVKIDRKNRQVIGDSGKKYNYDYCVIGLGVVTSYFGIKGLDKYSFSVKSSSAFDEFRHHLHQEIVQQHELDKNYVIVGAGPTGVELAAALKTYLKAVAKHHKTLHSAVNIRLVEAAPRILPTLSPTASKLTHKRLRRLGVKIQTNTAVKSETADSLMVGNEKVPTQTVVWTAGVTNNSFFDNNSDQFVLNARKRVIVDGHLQIDNRTFVIGDSAATPYSGLALTALHNAGYVSKHILRSTRGKDTKPYKPQLPVCIIPVGENWALFQWRKLVISGRLASFLRVMLDYIGYSEVMSLGSATRMWFSRNKIHEECEFCSDASDA